MKSYHCRSSRGSAADRRSQGRWPCAAQRCCGWKRLWCAAFPPALRTAPCDTYAGHDRWSCRARCAPVAERREKQPERTPPH